MPLIDDAYDALNNLRLAVNAGQEMGLHLFLKVKSGRERLRPWQRVVMSDALAERLKEGVRRSLTDLAQRIAGENALADFDFDAMVAGSTGVLDLNVDGEVGRWVAELPSPDHPDIFQGDERSLERAEFYAWQLELPGGAVRAFRSKSGLEVGARRPSRVVAFFNPDHRMLAPVEGAVISIDERIDFFEWAGILFVQNLPSFESVSNIREVTARKAVEAVDAIAARFDVGDVDALKQAVSTRTRLGKRLAAAHRYGLHAQVDPARVAQTIADRGLQFAVEDVEGGGVRFLLDHRDRRSAEDFVDLMSDVFLRSPTTGRDWEAIAKRVPRAR